MADPAAHPAFRYGQPSVAWLLGAAGLPAAVDPDTSAIRWAGSGLTYRELRDRALRLAGSLRASGLVVGDRVAAHLLNRGEFFELYFACAYAGLTFVPVSFRLTSEEVSLILDDCQARRLFTQEDLADTALPAAKLAGVADVTVLGSAASGQDYAELLSTEPWPGPYPVSDPHLILFSSGTTGRPKGAMLSHRAIVSYAMQQAALYPAYDRKTVLLITGPLFNTGGINDLTIATLLVGGTVTILPSRGWSAARMAEHIRRWGVTHTIVFPSMMEPMIRADQESPLDLGTLKLVVTGGENCPVAAVQRFRSRWPHLSVAIGYGSTEVGLASLIMNDEIGAHPGSVGRPAGGAAIKVVGERGEDVPAGSVGEIWMAADTAFSGYLNAPELNAETFRDGWVASGDLGRLDAGSLRHAGLNLVEVPLLRLLERRSGPDQLHCPDGNVHVIDQAGTGNKAITGDAGSQAETSVMYTAVTWAPVGRQHAHGAEIGVQAQLLAQRHVDALVAAADGSGGRSFQSHARQFERAKTSSGMSWPYSARARAPASTRSHSTATPVASTARTVASATSGPIPSPGINVIWCAITAIIEVGVAMIPDWPAERHAMVEKQLRRRGIRDPRVLAAMSRIAREEFVPVESRFLAYTRARVPLP